VQSEPYGYPLGFELKDKIIRVWQRKLFNWFEDLDIDVDIFGEFIRKFEGSTRTSIDSFLNYHKEEYAQIGKIAIANFLSNCENETKKPLTKKDIILSKYVEDDWYSYLADFLLNCEFDDITDNKLSIISYNYDRSLESFLYCALRFNYEEGESSEECASKIKEIPIVHMYGRLDPLPWETKGGRSYGQSGSSDELREISKNIKLIQEAKKEEIPKRADKLIKQAERVYFLGLDLRRIENLELLNLSNLEGKKIVGTAYGLESDEIAQIKRFMDKNSNKPNIFSNNSIIKPEKSLSMIRKNMAFK
jgi:hypothetical protein